MAQTGYTPIQLYYSSTTTNVPLAANLANGELAINITDGKLFYKDNAAAVQVIGWKTTPTSAGGTGLTSYTAGDMVYYASGTALSKLAIGAADYVMTSSGSAPQWSASLKAKAGGTGQTSYAVGDLLYAATTTTLAKLADVATGNALISGGVGVAPSWGKIGLTTHVSGTLAVGNGGTGITTTPTNGQLPIGNGTNYTAATLTAGAGITVTNASGSITIANNKAPAFAAKATAVQTVNNTTWTKLNFNSIAGTGFDTNSNFNTTTYRFTPTVAGYYQINGTGYGYPAVTGAVNLSIYLNGAGYTANVSAPNANQGPGLQVAALMYLNGSTDYVEIYIYQNSGGALTCGGNDFSGVMVRGA